MSLPVRSAPCGHRRNHKICTHDAKYEARGTGGIRRYSGPKASNSRDANGSLIANAGTYYIGGAYGGYRLERMSKGGGASDISPRLSKPALAEWINAYIDGIEVGRKI